MTRGLPPCEYRLWPAGHMWTNCYLYPPYASHTKQKSNKKTIVKKNIGNRNVLIHFQNNNKNSIFRYSFNLSFVFILSMVSDAYCRGASNTIGGILKIHILTEYFCGFLRPFLLIHKVLAKQNNYFVHICYEKF